MDWLAISSGITAIATGAIAYYSYVSNKLSNTIRAQETNYRQALKYSYRICIDQQIFIGFAITQQPAA